MEWTLVDPLVGADWIEGACTLLVPEGVTTDLMRQRCKDQLGEIHVMAAPDRFWVLATLLPGADGFCVQAMGSVCVPWGGDLQLQDAETAVQMEDHLSRWSARRRHSKGFGDSALKEYSSLEFASMLVALLCKTHRDWASARPAGPRRRRDTPPRDRRRREPPHRRRFSERRRRERSSERRRERRQSGVH